jgi:hypothetical protein
MSFGLLAGGISRGARSRPAEWPTLPRGTFGCEAFGCGAFGFGGGGGGTGRGGTGAGAKGTAEAGEALSLLRCSLWCFPCSCFLCSFFSFLTFKALGLLLTARLWCRRCRRGSASGSSMPLGAVKGMSAPGQTSSTSTPVISISDSDSNAVGCSEGAEVLEDGPLSDGATSVVAVEGGGTSVGALELSPLELYDSFSATAIYEKA